jgi:MFS family permease
MQTDFKTASSRAAFARLFRRRDFRRFTLANSVSVTGTWMQVIAQNWLVLRLTGDAAAVGIAVALQAMPSVVLGLVGGVAADRLPKQRVLIVTQVALGAVALVLGIATIGGVVTIGFVYALALCLGVLIAFDGPSNAALGAELVDESDLGSAIAIGSIVNGLGRIIGMSLGGVLIAVTGPGPVFLINAVSYLAVVTVVATLPARLSQARSAPAAATGVLGLRDAHRPSAIAFAAAIAFFVGALGRNYQVTMTAMCEHVFETGAEGYGFLSVVFAAGALCGGAGAALLRRHSLRLLAGVAVIGSALQVAGSIAPTFATFALMIFLIAFGAVVFDTAALSVVQLAAGDAHRGRAIAAFGTVSMLGVAIGGPLLGGLADRFGGRLTLQLGGLGVLTATVGLAAWKYTRRTVPAEFAMAA